jgi:transcriptional regulator GlxA family with amidase domain
MTRKAHTVAVLALDGVVGFDLAIPCQIFSSAMQDGRHLYEVRVCGSSGSVQATANGVPVYSIAPTHPLASAIECDTVIVPGISEEIPWPAEAIDVVRAAQARGARIASICTGAFVLAAAGLLDGLRATTHWAHAGELALRYPEVDVDPAVLYVDHGSVLTSAGVAAGLDLCLHIVRGDHGAAVASAAARWVVTPPQRSGGQAQFIVHSVDCDDNAALEPTMTWMRTQLEAPLTLAAIARHAGMSTRTLNRRFREETGTTPLQWLIHARVARACELLETTRLSVEQIADRTGFGSAAGMRKHFLRAVGTAPNPYRRTFQELAG